MKKGFLKRIMSLVLVGLMIVSMVMVSVVTTSATTNTKKYKVTIHTGGHSAVSGDIYKYTILGTNGSVDFKLSMLSLTEATETVECADLGEIVAVKVLHSAGCDDLYINYFNISEPDGKVTTIYGGRWIDKRWDGSDEEVVFSKLDNVYKLTIDTADKVGAGTNFDISVVLYDKNGNKSKEYNATSVHPATDAFEQNDSMFMYAYVPSKFGELDKINFCLSADWEHVGLSGAFTLGINLLIEWINGDWDFESVSAVKVSGTNIDLGKTYSKKVDTTLELEDYTESVNYTVNFN